MSASTSAQHDRFVHLVGSGSLDRFASPWRARGCTRHNVGNRIFGPLRRHDRSGLAVITVARSDPILSHLPLRPPRVGGPVSIKAVASVLRLVTRPIRPRHRGLRNIDLALTLSPRRPIPTRMRVGLVSVRRVPFSQRRWGAKLRQRWRQSSFGPQTTHL